MTTGVLRSDWPCGLKLLPLLPGRGPKAAGIGGRAPASSSIHKVGETKEQASRGRERGDAPMGGRPRARRGLTARPGGAGRGCPALRVGRPPPGEGRAPAGAGAAVPGRRGLGPAGSWRARCPFVSQVSAAAQRSPPLGDGGSGGSLSLSGAAPGCPAAAADLGGWGQARSPASPSAFPRRPPRAGSPAPAEVAHGRRDEGVPGPAGAVHFPAGE